MYGIVLKRVQKLVQIDERSPFMVSCKIITKVLIGAKLSRAKWPGYHLNPIPKGRIGNNIRSAIVAAVVKKVEIGKTYYLMVCDPLEEEWRFILENRTYGQITHANCLLVRGLVGHAKTHVHQLQP
jgi:hypothetical protein